MPLLQIPVPQHRLTPLRNSWMSLYTPITEHMQLDMRMNLKSKKVGIGVHPPKLQFTIIPVARTHWLRCRWRSRQSLTRQISATSRRLQTLCMHSYWVSSASP